jgi:pimeloyl-ACP methyl ester carboxylesterase
MHIRCLGEGSPAVIMESGAGGFSAMWPEAILTGVSQTTRVCTYDRAGYGWSDARPEPRTPWEIAHELHSLLRAATIAPPYVLVGVSNGGLYIRSFAAEYPDEVAGMVLSATSSEDTVGDTRGLSSTFFVVMGRLGIFRLFPEMICPGTACEETAKPVITAFRGRATLFETYDDEWAQLRSPEQLALLQERISPSGSLDDIPLAVLAANQTGLPDDELPDDYRATLDRERDLMTGLSSNARYERVASGHGLDIEHPDLVIEAINAVVAAARTGAPLAP